MTSHTTPPVAHAPQHEGAASPNAAKPRGRCQISVNGVVTDDIPCITLEDCQRRAQNAGGVPDWTEDDLCP
jgi:hypothetical protein